MKGLPFLFMSRPATPTPKYKKDIKHGDEFLCDARSTDLVIVVMGATGAGKSTFINYLFGTDVAVVGHRVDSCTEHVKAYHLEDSEFPNNRIILVDTPGFDDSKVLQTEIVRRISMWLAQSYSADMKIAGVIYCHDIMDTRWPASMQTNFHLFQTLCGPAAARKTVILTTRWDVPREIEPLIAREDELKDTYWKDMMAAGATVHHSQPFKEAAQDTIDFLLMKNAYYDPLQVQKELVDANMSFASTKAARMLFNQLLEDLNAHKQKVENLRDQGQCGDEVAEVEQKIMQITKSLKEFPMTMTRRFQLLVRSFS